MKEIIHSLKTELTGKEKEIKRLQQRLKNKYAMIATDNLRFGEKSSETIGSKYSVRNKTPGKLYLQ